MFQLPLLMQKSRIWWWLRSASLPVLRGSALLRLNDYIPSLVAMAFEFSFTKGEAAATASPQVIFHFRALLIYPLLNDSHLLPA